MKGKKKLYERYKTHPLFSAPKAFPSTNTFTDHNFQTQPLYIFLGWQSAQLLDCKQPNIYMPHILQNKKKKLKTIREVIRLKELTLYLLFLPNNGKNAAGRGWERHNHKIHTPHPAYDIFNACFNWANAAGCILPIAELKDSPWRAAQVWRLSLTEFSKDNWFIGSENLI